MTYLTDVKDMEQLVNDSRLWVISFAIDGLNRDDTLDIVIKHEPPESSLHEYTVLMPPKLYTEAHPVLITLYEGVEFTGGTPVPIYNRNRPTKCSCASDMQAIMAPTIDDFGTKIFEIISVYEAHERVEDIPGVFRNDTWYLLRLTGLINLPVWRIRTGKSSWIAGVVDLLSKE